MSTGVGVVVVHERTYILPTGEANSRSFSENIKEELKGLVHQDGYRTQRQVIFSIQAFVAMGVLIGTIVNLSKAIENAEDCDPGLKCSCKFNRATTDSIARTAGVLFLVSISQLFPLCLGARPGWGKMRRMIAISSLMVGPVVFGSTVINMAALLTNAQC